MKLERELLYKKILWFPHLLRKKIDSFILLLVFTSGAKCGMYYLSAVRYKFAISSMKFSGREPTKFVKITTETLSFG